MLDVVLTFLIQILEMFCLVLMPGAFLLYIGFAAFKRNQTLSDETTNQLLKPDKNLKTQKEMTENPTWFSNTPKGRKLLAETNKHPNSPNTPASPVKTLQPKMSPKATVEKDGQELTPLERAVEQYAPMAITEGKFTYSKRYKKWMDEGVVIDGAKISELMNKEFSNKNKPLIITEKALKIMEQQAKEETLYMPRSQESNKGAATEKEE